MVGDGNLEQRLCRALGALAPISEKRMFGGTCFMWRDHMLCGTGKEGFLFRVGKENDGRALARKGARPMVHGGRNMAGYVWVDPGACDSGSLKDWVELARSHVASLPAKGKASTGNDAKNNLEGRRRKR